MSPKPPRHSVDLRPEEVETLNAIADEAGCKSRSGPTCGKPSWRVLLKDIAGGKVFVIRKEKP